jgi:hypothetical protein
VTMKVTLEILNCYVLHNLPYQINNKKQYHRLPKKEAPPFYSEAFEE